jgi:hypothetical protein
MSKNPLRKDKTCLNCRYVVENRFCSNCGQENIDTRKSFHQLFIHFFEDLTHYENAFWKTIKNLLVKPATLTKAYLSGKRLSYLAPIRLYIFISFITFFLIGMFPDQKLEFLDLKRKQATEADSIGKRIKINKLILPDSLAKDNLDSIQSTINKSIDHNEQSEHKDKSGILTVRELDSIQEFGKVEDKYSSFQYSITKKALAVIENNTIEEIIAKFRVSFLHDFPKMLFIYLPLFALFLWIFHNKKRWYYFDHGIFTLHYFSFLLLLILILFLTDKIFLLFEKSSTLSFVKGLIYFGGFGWMIYYFFPAHHRFYGESRLVSFVKTIILFFINFIVIIVLLLLFAFYTFINIH